MRDYFSRIFHDRQGTDVVEFALIVAFVLFGSTVLMVRSGFTHPASIASGCGAESRPITTSELR